MENETIQSSTEKIKLIKNSRGYQWEITILTLDPQKLKALDNEMNTLFKTPVVVVGENE